MDRRGRGPVHDGRRLRGGFGRGLQPPLRLLGRDGPLMLRRVYGVLPRRPRRHNRGGRGCWPLALGRRRPLEPLLHLLLLLATDVGRAVEAVDDDAAG
jgi:hypothetical protein